MKTIDDNAMKIINQTELKNYSDQIRNHFFSLSLNDRNLRFCYPITDHALNEYIDDMINKEKDADYLLIIIDNILIGFAQICYYNENTAELALSVIEEYRGLKIGKLIFEWGMKLAKEKNKVIFISCKSSNKPVTSMMRKNGFKITFEDSEAIGRL